jgi:UDP-N-acetylglucosamine:LPS N-acetylglucosamine transferase
MWITFDTADAVSLLHGERVWWAHHPTTRNLPNALRNLALAWRLLRRERPDVVVSDGAGVAAPFFAVAKLLGVRTVYVEVYDRLDSRSLTGRLCYPLADLFCVQWEEQRSLYPRARLIGALL